MKRLWLQLFLLILLLGGSLWPMPVQAQLWPSVGGRAVSRDGRWLVPVAAPLLSSDEDDHLRRGSVNAWDLTVPLGTPVYPMESGRVSYAGCNNAGGYGCWALIEHDNGYTSIYAHLLDEGHGTIWVKAGERVTAWTVLGRVGWTGKTSFGPHLHWEIRHSTQGRLRNDQFFSRAAIPYCKFCPADGQASPVIANVPGLVAGPVYYTSRLFSREALLALVIIAIGLLLFFRPEVAVAAAHATGALAAKLLALSGDTFRENGGWRKRHWAYLVVIFVAPALICGTTTAFTIWLADEGISPRYLWAYLRYGVYPLIGGGYQSGAQYGAIWGMPCSGVGTLGQSCRAEEIVTDGLAWQKEIALVTGIAPVPVVIPRLSGHFGIQEARQLLTAMHREDGLVIIDTEEDFHLARTVIDELTMYGLDGVAIDLEFVHQVRESELRALAEHLAEERKAAGLRGEGVLVLWDVFHNAQQGMDLAVPGVRIVPIFTGYGSTAAKVAGLTRTQQLFEVHPVDSGLMAFDNRWPINTACQGFDTQRGYDCQNWLTLFADPAAQEVGWWVQQ